MNLFEYLTFSCSDLITVINIASCDIISTLLVDISTLYGEFSDKRYIYVRNTEYSVGFPDKLSLYVGVLPGENGLMQVIMDNV